MPTHRVTAWGEHTSLSDRKRRAGQRLLVRHLGPELPRHVRALLGHIRPAGFLVDAACAVEADQVRELIRESASVLPDRLPPLLGMILEGGVPWTHRVGSTAWPPPRTLPNAGDLSLTLEIGQAWGRAAAALGFNLVLGPVADVADPRATAEVRERSLGTEPHRVAEHLARLVRGLLDGGVIPCPHAFPGRGALSHPSDPLPALEKDPPDLLSADGLPFAAAIRAGADCLAVDHVRCPGWDDGAGDAPPASASARVILDGIREGLAFRGLLLGEDLAAPFLERPWQRLDHLRCSILAGVSLHACPAEPALLDEVFEGLVKLQEEDPALDRVFEDRDTELHVLRVAHLLQRTPPSSAMDDPAWTLLAVRARHQGA